MNARTHLIVAMVGIVAMSAGIASAQTSTHTVRQGTVLHVSGNQLLVELSDGTQQLFDVPPEFKFDIDGRMVTVDQLEPGTKLTQTIDVTTTPEIVKTVEIQEAEIVQRKGQTVIYRDAKTDKLHMVTGVPEGWIVFRDGKRVPIEALAGGDRATAYIIHEETKMMTEEDMRVAGIAPTHASQPVTRRPVSAPVTKPAPMLPKTGSQLPLVGLAGIIAITLGLGIASIRRS